jgi:hypothetical protein
MNTYALSALGEMYLEGIPSSYSLAVGAELIAQQPLTSNVRGLDPGNLRTSEVDLLSNRFSGSIRMQQGQGVVLNQGYTEMSSPYQTQAYGPSLDLVNGLMPIECLQVNRY